MAAGLAFLPIFDAVTVWPGCGDHEGETGRGRVAGGATVGNSGEESKDGHIAII